MGCTKSRSTQSWSGGARSCRSWARRGSSRRRRWGGPPPRWLNRTPADGRVRRGRSPLPRPCGDLACTPRTGPSGAVARSGCVSAGCCRCPRASRRSHHRLRKPGRAAPSRSAPASPPCQLLAEGVSGNSRCAAPLRGRAAHARGRVRAEAACTPLPQHGDQHRVAHAPDSRPAARGPHGAAAQGDARAVGRRGRRCHPPAARPQRARASRCIRAPSLG